MVLDVVAKRVYAPVESGDGFRVLVDRLWPRGLSKAAACIDLWAKDVAPSVELRRWFGHETDKWEEFQQRYSQELAVPGRSAALETLWEALRSHSRATLLFAARDEVHNHAVVLRAHLLDRLR